MITEIKKGDRFLCVKDVVMEDSPEWIAFYSGKEYESEVDNCIANEKGNINHHCGDIKWRFKYFTRIDPDTQQDLTREAIEQDEVESVISSGISCDMPMKPKGYDERMGQVNWNKVADKAAEFDAKEEQSAGKLIRRFKSGAVRSDNTGRPRPDWISPYAIEAISMRMVGVVNDFGAANYLNGIEEDACLESLVRHVGELQEAILITKDKDAAKEAAQGVGFNIVAMLHTMVLKEKGLYVERFERDELVTVEEAKQGINFTDKD